MKLKYLKNNEIDKQKWDKTVTLSPGAPVYAQSWYLDALCPHWDALITDDYACIMPLPWNSKWGIRYAYLPVFIQQLGVFSANEVDGRLIELFLSEARARFAYMEYAMPLPESVAGNTDWILRKRANFVLNLTLPYGEIAAKYSKDARRSLRNSEQISVVEENDLEFVLSNYLAKYGKMNRLTPYNRKSLKRLIARAVDMNNAIALTVMKDDQRWASALFFRNETTAFYVIGAPTQEGEKQNATHFLIDGFVRKFAEKLSLLDFEGSDIPGVAYFYQKWGSENRPYYHLKSAENRYKAILQYLKGKLR